jgi:hypothetical protein
MKELWQGLKERGIGCFRSPRETLLHLAGGRLLGIVRGDEEKKYLWTKHTSVLSHMCLYELKLSNCSIILREWYAEYKKCQGERISDPARSCKKTKKKDIIDLVYKSRQHCRQVEIPKQNNKIDPSMEFPAIDEPFGFCKRDNDCHMAALVHEFGMTKCYGVASKATTISKFTSALHKLVGRKDEDDEMKKCRRKWEEFKTTRSCVCHDRTNTGICLSGHGRCMCNPGYCIKEKEGYDLTRDVDNSSKIRVSGVTFGELTCKKAADEITSCKEWKKELDVWIQGREIELGSAVKALNGL